MTYTIDIHNLSEVEHKQDMKSRNTCRYLSFGCLFNCDHDDIFLALMSANKGDHELEMFCKYVHQGFPLRFDRHNSGRHDM